MAADPVPIAAAAITAGLLAWVVAGRCWPASRRGSGVHRSGHKRPAARVRALPNGTVWRPCHTTSCAHLTTQQEPAEGGRRCSECQHVALIPPDERDHAA